MMFSATTEGPNGGMLSALSNEMVSLYKTQLGRGPTKVRADWAGADAVIVTLEDSFTPAEHRLAEMNEHARLRDTRTSSSMRRPGSSSRWPSGLPAAKCARS